MLVPCWFTVFVFWPGHSTTKCQTCFWMCLFCFEVVNQRENYKWTTFYCEMLSSRMGCSSLLTLCSRFAHACSRFAHALLTLCSRFAHALLTLCSRSPRFLLNPLGSFWVLTRFLLGPYEDLLTVCSRLAHGLLTACSRFARAAHALLMLCSHFGGWCAYLDEEAHKQTMPFFVVPSHVYLRHTAFRLQTPWSWFSNLKKKHPHATHNPSLKRGCHTPASAWDMYVRRSFWAQRTQKVHPILWYYDMFLCSPKGPKSTSIDGIVQRSF